MAGVDLEVRQNVRGSIRDFMQHIFIIHLKKSCETWRTFSFGNYILQLGLM